ncbi:MAG: hypothetical protein Kow006_08400 [Gammaproteobacteria bacterium]
MRKTLALVMLGALASQSAHANRITEFNIQPDGPVKFRVGSSNGELWDTIEPGTHEFRVKVDADCRFDKKPGFQGHGAHEIRIFTPIGGMGSLVSPYLPPKSNSANRWLDTPAHKTFVFKKHQPAPEKVGPDNPYVKACNDELARRVLYNPEKTRYHFLAEGFMVELPQFSTVDGYFVCNPIGAGFSDDHSKQKAVDAVVQCLPSKIAEAKISKPKPKKAHLLSAIKSVQLKLSPSNYHGQCPVNIKVDAKITLNYPSEIKYQYIGDKGYKSPLFTLKKKNKGGTWNLAPWTRKIEIPNTTGQLAIGNNTGLFKHQGWMKVRILSPEARDAATSTFTVRCPRKPAKGPGSLQQAPAKPKLPATLSQPARGPESDRMQLVPSNPALRTR